MMIETIKIHPTIPKKINENLKKMGYKPSEALILFYNAICTENLEKELNEYRELLLRKKKLEQGIKILTKELKAVDNKLELKLQAEKFKPYNKEGELFI